jgi:hypothetical protein
MQKCQAGVPAANLGDAIGCQQSMQKCQAGVPAANLGGARGASPVFRGVWGASSRGKEV